MKIFKVHKKIIKYLFCMIFCLSFLSACGKKEITPPTYDDSLMPAEEIKIFAIISSLDEINGKITLRSVDFGTEIELDFTGSVDVKDKYGDVMAMSQVELGSIVDAVYDVNRDKLVSLAVSANAGLEKFESVSGVIINNVEETVQINGETYPMSNGISAFSDNHEIGIDEICSEDQITVWLYNDRVCSMFVELGHGYVKLSDYASYIGGMVEIGYDVIVPVTEDMLLTVREGEYTLRIAKGNDVGTKKVEVIKNQEVNISLADIAIEPKQIGSVLFKVNPSDAAVFLDGKRVNAEGAIDLVYGKHKILIMADGYETYRASFNVKYAYKIKEYNLTPLDGTSEEKTSDSKKTEASTSVTTTEQATTEKTTEATTEDKNENSEVKDVTAAEGKKTSNKVTVLAPVSASVYFDGEYLGIGPISFTKVTGSHIITFSKEGYLSKSYTVTFTDDGKDVELKYDELISISSLIE